MIIARLDEQGVLGFLILIKNSESSALGSTDYRLWRQKMQCLIESSQIANEKHSALLSLIRTNFALLEAFNVVCVSKPVDLGSKRAFFPRRGRLRAIALNYYVTFFRGVGYINMNCRTALPLSGKMI